MILVKKQKVTVRKKLDLKGRTRKKELDSVRVTTTDDLLHRKFLRIFIISAWVDWPQVLVPTIYFIIHLQTK